MKRKEDEGKERKTMKRKNEKGTKKKRKEIKKKKTRRGSMEGKEKNMSH